MAGDRNHGDHVQPGGSRRNEAESTFQLIERARSGDEDAINRLFARHAQPLRRWAAGRLPRWARDVADTDDLVQETLLQTFKRIGQFPHANVWLGRALMLSGRPHEAIAIFEESADLNWGYLGYAYAVSGRRADAEALAAKYADAPARLMLVHAGLGNKDRAFDALEQTADNNWWRAATWLIRPEMALLRGDPRLAAIRTKIGLPERPPDDSPTPRQESRD